MTFAGKNLLIFIESVYRNVAQMKSLFNLLLLRLKY